MVKVIRALVGSAVIFLAIVIPKVAPNAVLSDQPKPKCNCYFPNLGKYGVTRGDHCEVADCEPPKPKPTPTPTPKP